MSGAPSNRQSNEQPSGASPGTAIQRRFIAAPFVEVLDELGPVEHSTSHACLVTAANGRDYIIKGPRLSADHNPSVAANELAAALLADRLLLPQLDYAVIAWEGALFFGREWIRRGSGYYYLFVTEDLLGGCANVHQIYDLAVFDTWLCNPDRHERNLFIHERPRPGGGGVERTFLINDHSECLLRDAGLAANWAERAESGFSAMYVRLEFLKRKITRTARLGAAIRRVEDITDVDINSVVTTIPTEFFPNGGREGLTNFLTARRDELRSIFDAGRDLLPHLDGGAI